MSTPRVELKETLLRVADELTPNRLLEVVDFALFVKARDADERQPVATEALGSSSPLRGTVIRYENPFESVAEADWEVLK